MATVVTTEVWITDSSFNRLTKILAFYPLDKQGTILTYSKELDDYGQCKFRVSAYDTSLTTFGDILVPHKNWVQLYRGGNLIWQGAIIENTKRTKEFIEIVAVEPLWYLDKILINRTSPDPTGGGGVNIYRIFGVNHTTGASYMGADLSMSAAVTSLVNETITTFQSNSIHPLNTMTLGTVTNPNYPPNMTDGNSPPNKLSGAWKFGDGISGPLLQYDFHSLFYVLKSFGVYTYANFYLDNSLVFNFVPFKGNNLSNKIQFNFGGSGSPPSSIVDYNIPRLGQRMVNDLYGIAVDPNGLVLHYDVTDQASISTYGLIQGVAAYSDVKDQATLNARLEAEVPLVSAPDNAAISVILDEKGYPIGQYDVGDIVSINIQNKAVTFSDQRRVVGISVKLNNTGREITTVQTNKVLPFQFASLGA